MERGGMAFDVLFRLLSGGPKRNQIGLSERMSWSADHDLNPGSPEYETEILPLLRLWVRDAFQLAVLWCTYCQSSDVRNSCYA